MRPCGSSRIAVRGLRASNDASTSRLNPMAALRAATMQATIHTTRIQPNGTSLNASSAPVSANGSANTEWLKRTKDAYVWRRASMSDGHGVDERAPARRRRDILPHQ